MDGEADAMQTPRLLAALRDDVKLRETWATYHLIGDALRGELPLAVDVRAAVARRLAAEPTVFAPARRAAPLPSRLPLAALAASVAAVAFVGLAAWQVTRPTATPANLAPLAAASAERPQAAPPPADLPARSEAGTRAKQPPRVRFPAAAGDAYLLAHQEFSPTVAMVGMPAYVRTVSEEDGQ
jgi:sigma-E factor negative regulatory protein RseA